MQKHKETSSAALDSLAIALAHPLLSSHRKVLCAAAQVCRAWRDAVQQCEACNLIVELGPSTPVLKLCSFAAWLPRHAALVKSITAKVGNTLWSSRVDGLAQEPYNAVVAQLLQPALQLARLLPPDSAAAAAAEGPASCARTSNSYAQQPGLRLQRFSSNLPGSAGVLADLPAHSLTALNLSFQGSIGTDESNLSAQLARLSSLQQLRLSSVSFRAGVPGSCLSELASLGQLTQLTLAGFWRQVGDPLKQLLEQRLPLRRLVLHIAQWHQLQAMNMALLTSLEELETEYELPRASVLPAQLQRLQVGVCTRTEYVTALQRLQQLGLGVHFDDCAQLLGLAQLASLRHVELRYTSAALAAATAAAWQHLPQLQELSVDYDEGYPDSQQMADILVGIAACTQLTKLELMVGIANEEQDDGDDFDVEELPVAVCARLAGLTHLQHLAVPPRSYLAPGDVLALTALTALTHLDLRGASGGLDDVVANALACSLKQLRHLDLSYSKLGSLACLAAIGHLSSLTALKLDAVDGVTERGLMLLTRLSSLQSLSVVRNGEITDEVMCRFWAASRQQLYL